MTATKGMLWKTAWRRRTGGFVQQQPVDMWFFDATYKQPVPAPCFTQGPEPFWFGFVGIGMIPTAADGQVVATNGIFIEYVDGVTTGNVNNEQLLCSVNPTNGVNGLVIHDPGSPGTPSVNPLVPYLPGVTVTVGFVYVYPDPAVPGQTKVSFYVDGRLLQTVSGPPYAAATKPLTIIGRWNGLVGGVASLSPTDISNWFVDVRQQRQVVAAPGMTDLWSATSVAPAAPAILPNGGSGQVLTILGPGTNNLLPVVFNY